jgi:hypothetical protein
MKKTVTVISPERLFQAPRLTGAQRRQIVHEFFARARPFEKVKHRLEFPMPVALDFD